MTESQNTQELLKQIKAYVPPGILVLKHCDRFTAGVPDLSISSGRTTLWVECKMLRGNADLEPRLFVDSQVQLEYACRVRGWYYVYQSKLHKFALWEAEAVRRVLNSGTAYPALQGMSTGHTITAQYLTRILKEETC